MSNAPTDPKRELLRHAVATLAYRAGKALRNAPPAFADFQGAEGLRTPAKILAHMGDLFAWATSIAQGKEAWSNATPAPWDQEVARFFGLLKNFDDYLASPEPLHAPVEKLIQGPVADALTHTGQLAMLRRMASSPVKGENYSVAEIAAGRVGADQASPKREF